MRRSSPPKASRKKKCRVCTQLFRPFNTIQATCLKPECVLEYGRRLAEKQLKREHRAKMASHRDDKERIKPLSRVMADTQVAFNAFIRLRDVCQPCISCDVISPPGGWDCGHYLTRGAHPELRFDELNAHRQCKKCNGGAGFSFGGRKGRTVQHEYRKRLIARLGLEAVEWLEGPHEPKRYRVDELREIKAKYQRKRLELRKQNESSPGP